MPACQQDLGIAKKTLSQPSCPLLENDRYFGAPQTFNTTFATSEQIFQLELVIGVLWIEVGTMQTRLILLASTCSPLGRHHRCLSAWPPLSKRRSTK